MPLAPLLEIKDPITSFFKSLDYKVSWDLKGSQAWYEISDDEGVFCQIDMGVPLYDLILDMTGTLPCKQNYQIHAPESERYNRLIERIRPSAQYILREIKNNY